MFNISHYDKISEYRDVGLLEQSLFLAINLFIITFGLMGNIGVLVGSIRYRALKMDKVSLIFVHNIALADITFIVIRYIPTTVTLFAKDWLFGRVGCFLLGFASNVPSCTELGTIVLLSLYRLSVLKQTPSQRLLNFKQKLRAVRFVLIVFWIMTSLVWLGTVLLGFEVVPGPKATTCVIGYSFYASHERITIITGFMLALFLLAPLLTIFTVNTYILYVISKSSERAQRHIPARVLATIPLVCLAYFGSNICTLFYAAFLNFSRDARAVSTEFYIVIHYLESINLLVNPVIYCIREEFRVFVWRCATLRLDYYSFSSVLQSGDSDKLTPVVKVNGMEVVRLER